MNERHVVVVGSMGAGKSTTAERVAAELDRVHLDGDDLLESRHGVTGRQLAAAEGVARLHELEAQVTLEALDHDEPAVVSAAASAVDHDAVRAALADHVVVWLRLDPANVVARRRGGGHRRPMSIDDVARLQRQRHDHFASLADVVVDAAPPTEQVVADVLARLPDR